MKPWLRRHVKPVGSVAVVVVTIAMWKGCKQHRNSNTRLCKFISLTKYIQREEESSDVSIRIDNCRSFWQTGVILCCMYRDYNSSLISTMRQCNRMRESDAGEERGAETGRGRRARWPGNDAAPDRILISPLERTRASHDQVPSLLPPPLLSGSESEVTTRIRF